jgi:hypothetical protein
VFPNEEAFTLKAIKEGRIDLDEATYILTGLFNQIDEAVAASTLPTRTPVMDAQFANWKLTWLRRFYQGQV